MRTCFAYSFMVDNFSIIRRWAAVMINLNQLRAFYQAAKCQNVSVAYLKNQPLSPPAQAFIKSMENLGTKKMRFQGMGALMAEMLAEEK